MVVFEPYNIKINEQVIPLNLFQSFDDLSPARDSQDNGEGEREQISNGVKIVQLSDFHSWWFGSREKRVLEILEELNPDFVFITGDFVDPITKAITDRDLNSVKIFWQKLGEKYEKRIFGVLGNHDTDIVKNYLKGSGITILDNENKKLFFGNEFIYLIGVDDPWTGRDDLSKAMEGVELEIPKILLAHAAEIIDEAIEQEIDLVLVGHTHGGQVSIPVLGRLIQPLSEYGKKYTSGFFKIDASYMYVNRGVGTSFLPIRFNSPPEITLIEFKKK